MNGIEKITARIAGDAAAEIEKLQAESKAQCDEIAKKSAAEAQEEYARLLKQGTLNAKHRQERLNSVAELEAKKIVLGEKQDLIARTFDRAVEMLRDLPEDKYIAFLAKLAAEASSDGTEQIVLCARDQRLGLAIRDKANDLLKAAGKSGGLTLSGDARDILGGLVLTKGNIETNCSLDVLVSAYKNELAGEVAKTLFD